jgi:hypothetical protein
MRKQRLLWSIIGEGIIVATLLWWCLPDRGPRYQGKSIGYWFRSSGNEQAKAFRAMGTNAVPYLVAQVKKKDSWWTGFYWKSYPRLPLWLQARLPWPQALRTRQSRAVGLLANMGRSARAAVPDLIHANRWNRAKPSSSAAPAIAGGSAAPLAKVMAGAYASAPNSDLEWRDCLIAGLIFIGGDDPELVPTVLGEIGPAASPAISALQEALKDEYSDVQNAAKEALKKVEAKP